MPTTNTQVRTTDPMVGGMEGHGDLLERYTGFPGRFKMYGDDALPNLAHGIQNIMQGTGEEFNDVFVDKGVGWLDMLQVQREYWPPGSPWYPQCWATSKSLGNAMHCDKDGACIVRTPRHALTPTSHSSARPLHLPRRPVVRRVGSGQTGGPLRNVVDALPPPLCGCSPRPRHFWQLGWQGASVA